MTYFGIVVIMIMFWLTKDMMIVKEYERVAAFRYGRFMGIKGPGLMYPLKPIDRYIRLRLGTQGICMSEATVRISGYDIPVAFDGKAEVGALYRVSGFEKFDAQERVIVSKDVTPADAFKCPHCGLPIKLA